MGYTAVVIQANDIMPHPNADRLNLLRYNGMQFVVSKDISIGDMVILFGADGQLSDDFCRHNNLYRDSAKNIDKSKSGFFEDNRRVRVQPFRKEKSYGFVAELSMFDYLGKVNLSIGDEFDTLNKKPICNRYYTPATLRAMNSVQGKKIKDVQYTMPEHFETTKFSYFPPQITEPSLVFISEKCHGTSARTSYTKVIRRKNTLLSLILGSKFKKETCDYEYVTGTHRTIANDRLDITMAGQQDHYRWEWHEKISPQLHKGEIIYYEIVGYDSLGGTIMEKQELSKLTDKSKIDSAWRNPMIYSYGLPEGQNDVYVYRIVHIGDDNSQTELSWYQVEQRCRELGLKTVPVLQRFMTSSLEEIKNVVASYMVDASSFLDDRHLMEGVVIRIENSEGVKVLKEKNYLFGVLEGYLEENKDYVDNEEVN